MKIVLLLVLSLLLIQPSAVCKEKQENLFLKANQLYFQNHFADALGVYQKILSDFKFKSLYHDKYWGDIFFNIGNCYYRMDSKGLAILNYQKAGVFLPRDADLKYNLAYVQNMTKDEELSQDNIIDTTFFWVKYFSQSELAAAFCLINVLFFAMLALRLFFKTELSYYISILFFITWIFCSVSLCFKLINSHFDNRVVILDKEVAVYAGPEKNDTLLFKLHEGTIGFFERNEYGFSLIRLADGKRGWLTSSSIEVIIPRG